MKNRKIALSVIAKARQEKANTLSEFEAKQFLSALGLPTCREKLIDLLADQEICAAAEEIGYPVVLKACGRKITHKTERGLVCLNIRSQDDLLRAVKEMRKRVNQDEIDGLLIQKMLQARRELMFGYIYDEFFGPCVAFGLGGILTEVIDDLTFRLVPLTDAEALNMLKDIKAQKILAAFRGEEPLNLKELTQILKSLAVVSEIKDIKSVDLNPVVIHQGQAIIVDALVTLNDQENLTKERSNAVSVPKHLWTYLFQPQKIALVGFSEELTHPGRLLWESLKRIGYQGKIYLVHPKITEFEGLSVYPNLSKLPEQVEMVIVCVAAPRVNLVLKEAGKIKVLWAVVVSSGFSELGTKEGEVKEKELLAVARQENIRLIGPNCLGVYCPKGGLAFFPNQEPVPGTVSIFSQSGSVATFIDVCLKDLKIPVAKLVSFGNAVDVGPEELLAYFNEDTDTEIIAGYLEGSRQPGYLLNVLRKIKKPVIIYKAGKSEAGKEAVISHTGALAGSSRLWDGLFKQTGVISVTDVEELIDTIAAFYYLKSKNFAGNKMAIITPQGGAGVSAVDACEEFGFTLASLSEKTRKKIKEIIPGAGTSIKNPLDLGFGSTSPYVFQETLNLVAQDPTVDLVLAIGGSPTFLGKKPFLFEEFAEWLAESAHRLKKPLVASMIDISLTRRAYQILYQAGIPTYGNVRRAVRALSHLSSYFLR